MSDKCDQVMPKLPTANMVLDGHTIDLHQNQLIVGAYFVNPDNEKRWTFLSMSDARAGLLANNWTETHVEGPKAPKNHVSFKSKDHLHYVGGDYEAHTYWYPTKGKGERGEWVISEFFGKDSNGDAYEFASYACSVQGKDHKHFLVIGGTTKSGDVLDDIYEINTEEMKAQRLGKLIHKRTNHACAVISVSLPNQQGLKDVARTVLITGGRSNPGNEEDQIDIVAQDELFVIDDLESKKGIELTMKKPRFNHNLVQLGDAVFAMGGLDGENKEIQTIEKLIFKEEGFTPSTLSPTSAPSTPTPLSDLYWELYSKTLKSESTSRLATTSIPESAIECNRESETCQCGKKTKKTEKIVDGTVVRKPLSDIYEGACRVLLVH